jgi:hypothetical protein
VHTQHCPRSCTYPRMRQVQTFRDSLCAWGPSITAGQRTVPVGVSFGLSTPRHDSMLLLLSQPRFLREASRLDLFAIYFPHVIPFSPEPLAYNLEMISCLPTIQTPSRTSNPSSFLPLNSIVPPSSYAEAECPAPFDVDLRSVLVACCSITNTLVCC